MPHKIVSGFATRISDWERAFATQIVDQPRGSRHAIRLAVALIPADGSGGESAFSHHRDKESNPPV